MCVCVCLETKNDKNNWVCQLETAQEEYGCAQKSSMTVHQSGATH